MKLTPHTALCQEMICIDLLHGHHPDIIISSFSVLKKKKKKNSFAENHGIHVHRNYSHDAVLCLVAQSCPTLCDPMDYSLPGSSVHGDSPGKNTGVGCHALLREIF